MSQGDPIDRRPGISFAQFSPAAPKHGKRTRKEQGRKERTICSISTLSTRTHALAEIPVTSDVIVLEVSPSRRAPTPATRDAAGKLRAANPIRERLLEPISPFARKTSISGIYARHVNYKCVLLWPPLVGRREGRGPPRFSATHPPICVVKMLLDLLERWERWATFK